jgi:hypothetical protein
VNQNHYINGFQDREEKVNPEDRLIAILAKKILKLEERNASLAVGKKVKIVQSILLAVQHHHNVQEKEKVKLGVKRNDKISRLN